MELAQGMEQNPGWTLQQAKQASPVPRKQLFSSMPFLALVLTILALGLGVFSYWAFASASWNPPVPYGYESYQQLSPGSEPYQQPPPESEYYVQSPGNKKPNEAVYLINNPNAKDISFAELKSFIIEDNTNDAPYIFGVRMCGHFAEELHNNAERAGIRAAFVIVEFEGETPSHAINAFQTIDRGLVYIDSTGILRNATALEEWLYQLFRPLAKDKVAYIELGKKYGLVNITKAELPQYSFYIGYAQGSSQLAGYLSEHRGIVSNVKIYW